MTSPTIQRNQIFGGDAAARMRGLPNSSIECVVTSPPNFWLRDCGLFLLEVGAGESTTDEQRP